MVVKSPAQEEHNSAGKQLYQEIIGYLLFLCTRKGPDISAPAGLHFRHSSLPKYENLTAAKRVLRYLQGTKISLFGHRSLEPNGRCFHYQMQTGR